MHQELAIKRLEWDSNFFGYKIGSIINRDYLSSNDLALLIDQAKSEGYKLVFLKRDKKILDLEKIQCKFNILLADSKITYSQTISPSGNYEIQPFIKEFNETYSYDKLYSLALQSGVYSRFAIDPNFKNQEFEKLYTIWIEKSVSKEIAKEVWVSFNETKAITGFITIGLKDNIPDIGLLAVDRIERGKDFGRNLIKTACSRVALWGSNSIQVVTQQDNIQACQFYEKMGFSSEKLEYIYHIWL